MKKHWKAVLAAGVVAMAGLGAMAQQPQQPDTGLGLGVGQDEQDAKPKEAPRPPIARKSDPKPPVLWNFAAFIVILGAVFGANMIPSKRGHQD
jgi:hypothetical protein